MAPRLEFEPHWHCTDTGDRSCRPTGQLPVVSCRHSSMCRSSWREEEIDAYCNHLRRRIHRQPTWRASGFSAVRIIIGLSHDCDSVRTGVHPGPVAGRFAGIPLRRRYRRARLRRAAHRAGVPRRGAPRPGALTSTNSVLRASGPAEPISSTPTGHGCVPPSHLAAPADAFDLSSDLRRLADAEWSSPSGHRGRVQPRAHRSRQRPAQSRGRPALSSTGAAEMTKLVENTFRAVNTG
jgi:hypothetical protein